MACYRVSTHGSDDARQTGEDIACDDEATAFLVTCAGLVPGERRELRHGARLVAIVIGPRPRMAKKKAVAAQERQG